MAKRKQRITPHALLEIKTPGDVHLSPDATRVAFVVDETNWDDNEQVQHLFVGSTSEAESGTSPTPSSRGESRQVTHGKALDGFPRWSPDGKHLAFLRTPHEDDADDPDDGEARAQVWVLPMDGLGGEAEKLTDAKQGVDAFEWLPDSKGIVYLAEEPRAKAVQTALDDRTDDNDDAAVDREERFRQQIWRIDLEHKKAKLVHAGDFGIGEIAVAPDGMSVAFSTNYTGEPNDYHLADIWVLPIDGGAPRQVTTGPGGKFHPVWSPNGSRLFFVRSLDPELSYSQENIYSVDAANGGDIFHETADFPHDVTGWHSFQFDAAGSLYVTAAMGTATAIFVRKPHPGPLLGKERETSMAFDALVNNDEHISEFSVAKNGAIAYVSSAVDDAPEVLFLPHKAKQPIRPSDLNGDWMDDYEIAPTDIVKWTSKDGMEIEGLLTYPVDFDESKRYPIVVNVHGGPHGRVVQMLSSNSLSQVLAADGFLVLSPNYRGSEGYGNEFSTANKGDLGGGDFDDVLAGVDWAVEEGIADVDRIGIMGSSYGGYLVNWAIARSSRFKAAVSAFGIFSFISDFSNSEAPRWEAEYFGGPYWERHDEYVTRSPSAYAKDIDTPVLILHGDDDANTFISNSTELYNALRLQGKTAQLVTYPREGHGFYEPMHRIDEMRRCRTWFDKYLIGNGAASTYRLGDHVDVDGWRLTVVSAEVEPYSLAPKKGRRYLEVQCIVRDIAGSGGVLTIGPGDFKLMRKKKTMRPAGIPIDVLGQKALAEGQGWRLRFEPDKDETGVTASVAVAFRIADAGGPYSLSYKNFPDVTFEIAPADEDDDEAKREQPDVP